MIASRAINGVKEVVAMSRVSGDLVDAQGIVRYGFDYNLQVWVKDYICQPVGEGRHHAGQDVRTIEGHEVR